MSVHQSAKPQSFDTTLTANKGLITPSRDDLAIIYYVRHGIEHALTQMAR